MRHHSAGGRGRRSAWPPSGETTITQSPDELELNIDNSRRHYQIALWIIVPASVVGFLLICGLPFVLGMTDTR